MLLILKPHQICQPTKTKKGKDDSRQDPKPSTSGTSSAKISDSKSVRKHLLSLKSRKLIVKSKAAKDNTDSSDVVKKNTQVHVRYRVH